MRKVLHVELQGISNLIIWRVYEQTAAIATTLLSTWPHPNSTESAPAHPLSSNLQTTPRRRIQLKAGFPPKNVSGSDGDPVAALGVTTGSALTVLELAAPPTPASSPPPPAPTPAPAPASSDSSPTPPAPPQLQRVDPGLAQSLVEMGFPQEIAEGALEAGGGDFETALEMCMSGDLSQFITGAGSAGAVCVRCVSVWRASTVLTVCVSERVVC